MQRRSASFAPSRATGNEVRLDVCARGFWQTGQMAFFDVRVFNPNARRYAKQELSKTYQLNVKERNASTMNELCRLNTAHFHHLWYLQPEEWDELPELMSEKRGSSYSIVATRIRRNIIFTLIKSIGMCLRDSRSVFHREKLKYSITDDELLSELS